MWYFTWILGLLLACSLGIINVLRLEAQESLAKDSLALDPLTHLLTKPAIWQRMREKVDNSRRNRAPFSLLFLSTAEFVQKNALSVHEHNAVLWDVVAVLKKNLREGLDLAARFDQDSFLVVLTGVSLPKAQALARTIALAIETTIQTSENQTISVRSGVVEYTPQDAAVLSIEEEVEQLVSKVQQVM